MTKEQNLKCSAIIHSASGAAAAVGAGLAQVPLSDTVAIGVIQTSMIIGLGEAFGINVSESAAKAGTSGIAGKIGRGVSAVLWGWIPGVGNAINAGTAGVLTEILGWMIAEEFERRSKSAVSAA